MKNVVLKKTKTFLIEKPGAESIFNWKLVCLPKSERVYM